MRRTKIIFYPSPPWTEATVERERKLQKKAALSCEVVGSLDPKGWSMTVIREYPDA